MKERTTPVRDYFGEYIDDVTGEYIKSQSIKEQTYSFYIRFLKNHFRPCSDCQGKLHKLFDKGEFYLGNKSYEPAIELNRQWVVVEDEWKEVERREATEDDFKRIYGSKWENIWNAWNEES